MTVVVAELLKLLEIRAGEGPLYGHYKDTRYVFIIVSYDGAYLLEAFNQ